MPSPLPLVTFRNLKKKFGAHSLFNDLTLGFSQGERAGLIGPNGSGKSTLLRIAAGLESPDEGEVICRRDCRVVYLGQEDSFPSGCSVEEVLLDAVKDETDEVSLHVRINRMLSQAGFADPSENADNLSGGWLKRLSLARALVQEPDLLLLDEPTNHLDLLSILWLEDILASARFSFVLVSHDRRFLERLCNTVIELNQVYPDGYFRVKGGYSRFIQERFEFISARQNLESSLSNRLRRETQWLRRGPKARTTKAHARIEAAAELGERLDYLRSRNRMGRNVEISFDSTGRKTRKLIRARGISKELSGRQLFHDLDVTLGPGMCLGLAGDNGCGKSTLMNILAGRMQPDSGTVKHADGLKIAFFDQKRAELDKTLTLRRALAPDGDMVQYQGRMIHVAGWSRRFLFRDDQLDMPVSYLSGGEQARILIARFMSEPADVLFLDEPTNDLDIDSIQVLEESLLEFPGAVVLVSHDREFLDNLADQIIGFGKRGETAHYASVDQWIETVLRGSSGRKTGNRKKKAASRKSGRSGKPAKRLSYKEQKELEQIEERILEAEESLDRCRAMVESPDIIKEPSKLALWCTRLQEEQERVDALYQRWEELEGKANGSWK